MGGNGTSQDFCACRELQRLSMIPEHIQLGSTANVRKMKGRKKKGKHKIRHNDRESHVKETGCGQGEQKL